jgi:tetratricopeptide (TPR) repeat protein
MSTENQHPCQALFDRGVSLIEKHLHNEGLAQLKEAQRLGHPQAAAVIEEILIVRKVIGLAHAGECELATACLEDAERRKIRIAPESMAQLRRVIAEVPPGAMLAPTDHFGWNEMGATLSDSGLHRKASACFMRAIELDQGYETAWLNLGLALAKLGEPQNALQCFGQLVSIKPESIQGWLLKGMAHGTLHQQAEAITSYDRALRLDPNLAAAWYNKSLALGWLNRFEESIECCDRALRLDPRDVDALFNKGKALYKLGRVNEATECAQQMQRIDPEKAARLLGTAG